MKKASISYLRIFATIAVLCSHAASTLVLNEYEMSLSQWHFFNIAMYLLKFGVPTFVIITGALLLSPEKNITHSICIKKFTLRMVLALFIFGVPFAFLVMYFNDRTLSSFSVGKLLIMVLNNEGLSHLWYLFLMIGIYLILPFVKTFTENCNLKLLRYMLLVLFSLNSIIPFINDVFEINIQVLPQIGIYVFYMLLGFYLSRDYTTLQVRNYSILAIVCVIILLIIVEFTGGSGDLIMRYSSPFNVLISSSIFMLFNYNKQETSGIIWKIDRLCFGVYLIHPIFIQFLYRYLKITPICELYSFVYIVFCIIFCIISFVGSWIMSLIKPLKKYVL